MKGIPKNKINKNPDKSTSAIKRGRVDSDRKCSCILRSRKRKKASPHPNLPDCYMYMWVFAGQATTNMTIKSHDSVADTIILFENSLKQSKIPVLFCDDFLNMYEYHIVANSIHMIQ